MKNLFLLDFMNRSLKWDRGVTPIAATVTMEGRIPERVLAICMPSVVSTFDRNPPQPRVTSTNIGYIDGLVVR